MKEQLPLVSIITPSFNLIKGGRLEYVKQNFESIHSQTYTNIEHIVVDGDSTDGTVALLEEYKMKGWITYISEKDTGTYDAMNKGIKLAKGKYIAFINTDDYYINPNAVKDSVEILEKTGASFSYANTQGINHLNDKKVELWKGNIYKLPFGTHFCHQSMFVKKSDLDELGGFDLSYKISADSDEVIRLVMLNKKFVYLPEVIVAYRSGGLSNTLTESVRKEHSKSFFTHIGSKYGLTEQDCYDIWNYKLFDEKPLEYCLNFGKKLSDINWLNVYNEVFADYIKGKEENSCSPKEWKIITIKRKVFSVLFPSNSILRKLAMKMYRFLKKIIKF